MVLIPEQISPEFVARLEANDIPAIAMPVYDREELFRLIPEAEILVIRSRVRINAELLKCATKLKLIIRLGSGTEHIDEGALKKHGAKLITTPEGNRDAVAEQAIGMLLSLFSHIHTADRELRQFKWNRAENRGIEIGGKTVGIIGFGNTGSALAQKLASFSANVIAYDKYKSNFSSLTVREVSFEELLDNAEIISLHIPLNNETRNLVNKQFIDRVAYPFWLLNLARGGIVQMAALIEGLQSGKIRGAALDVFENEDWNNLTEAQQYELYALFQMNNTILTPHTGGLTVESETRLQNLAYKAILQHYTQELQKS